MLNDFILRVINPVHLYKIISLNRNKNRVSRTYADEQLKLYSQITPNGFLHYGYFDDVSIDPKEISVGMIYRAQERYAEVLLEKITNQNDEILDVGCGMGGLINMMLAKKLKPVALTPDKTQIQFIKEKYKNTPIYGCKFEDTPQTENANRFGTIITSESLQYLDLDKSLPLITNFLKKDGKWIACDYFKINNQGEKSGHNWEVFEEKLKKSGFKIIEKTDITPHILPTISYLYFMAVQIGLPVLEFALDKLKVKKKGIYYAIEPFVEKIYKKLTKNIQTIDPELFKHSKMYVLMVIEKV